MKDVLQYCIKNQLLKKEEDFLKWFNIVSNILENEEFKKRKYFKHHKTQSVYEHCIMVSIISYNMAIKHKANVENCAIAGLLHDFYTYAWQYSKELDNIDEKYKKNLLQENRHKPLLKKHAFVHAIDAIENTKKYFPEVINEKIINAIGTHMFPLSIFTTYKMPKYKESWIVMIADDIATFKDLPTILEIMKYTKNWCVSRIKNFNVHIFK